MASFPSTPQGSGVRQPTYNQPGCQSHWYSNQWIPGGFDSSHATIPWRRACCWTGCRLPGWFKKKIVNSQTSTTNLIKALSKPQLRLPIRLRLAWPRGCFDTFAHALHKRQGFRREDGAWSRTKTYFFKDEYWCFCESSTGLDVNPHIQVTRLNYIALIIFIVCYRHTVIALLYIGTTLTKNPALLCLSWLFTKWDMVKNKRFSQQVKFYLLS